MGVEVPVLVWILTAFILWSCSHAVLKQRCLLCFCSFFSCFSVFAHLHVYSSLLCESKLKQTCVLKFKVKMLKHANESLVANLAKTNLAKAVVCHLGLIYRPCFSWKLHTGQHAQYSDLQVLLHLIVHFRLWRERLLQHLAKENQMKSWAVPSN